MFKMQGVVPPTITPFDENGAVDFGGVKKLTEYLSQNVDGLFITGSYGSGTLMSTEERKAVVEATINAAQGRVPVVVHVGTTDTKSAAQLTAHAKANGAAAVSAVGPFYYKHNADSICAFFEGILEAAGSSMPVYVYNNPGFQGYPIDMHLIKRLKALGVAGIKDATFDIIEHANYMRVLKDDNFDIVLGTEAMWLSARVLGCEAYIPGLGNALPEICGQMYREGMAGEYDKLRETQFRVNEIRDIMYLAKSTQLAIYAMLEIRGILKAYPRSPFLPATDDEKKAIKVRLQELDVI